MTRRTIKIIGTVTRRPVIFVLITDTDGTVLTDENGFPLAYPILGDPA